MPSDIDLISQEGRVPCSLPLPDADLSLGNANWSKGLQAMSDWIWSGNLNPAAFPNNLGRYFLHIPGIFEQQLNFSTTLIFDEPSFKNGVQISGFIDRVTRELVISFIGQRRRSRYTMTHHAVLGYMTAKKHGLTDEDYAAKWSQLLDFSQHRETYSDLQTQVLAFADAFATNAKDYTSDQYQNLRAAFKADNASKFAPEERWMRQLEAARVARSQCLLAGTDAATQDAATREAADGVGVDFNDADNERKINAQVVELAFLCLQFVALTDVFTGLNVPDESFLPDVIKSLLPDVVIAKLNDLISQGDEGLPSFVPPSVELPLDQIIATPPKVVVEPAPLKGSRIPLESYELNMLKDRDKGVTVGGAQVGVYGWSFGFHFPGSLVYALALHPELGRYEAPYSLPLLFNEDEWRNGTQTGGYTPRLLRELVYQKIYRISRSRYGLEHHTMFLYNSYLDLYGVNRPPQAQFNDKQKKKARGVALKRADDAVRWMLEHKDAPDGVFSEVEKSVLSWTEELICHPHRAHLLEPATRAALDEENRREVRSGLRTLDTTPGLGDDAAHRRLVDHQIAELSMLIGHMDGLGRALTILRLESEDPVQLVQGTLDPATGSIKPELDDRGSIQPTGYFNTRPGLLQTLRAIGVSDQTLTINELLLNPDLNSRILEKLKDGHLPIKVSASDAARTGEF
jgi:hypothetical protein